MTLYSLCSPSVHTFHNTASNYFTEVTYEFYKHTQSYVHILKNRLSVCVSVTFSKAVWVGVKSMLPPHDLELLRAESVLLPSKSLEHGTVAGTYWCSIQSCPMNEWLE